MKAWIKLTTDDLALVFNAKELAVVAPSGPDSANPWTLDTLDDVTAMVRESIASNPANALDDDQATIPRTLRAAAMDIAAVRLLKRFSMAITDERRKAADDAAALLVSIARAERKVMGPDGKVHVPASQAVHYRPVSGLRQRRHRLVPGAMIEASWQLIVNSYQVIACPLPVSLSLTSKSSRPSCAAGNGKLRAWITGVWSGPL